MTNLIFESTIDKAHGPRGIQARMPIYVFRFHPNDGSMVLLNICGKDKLTSASAVAPLINPAFSRFHPRLNVVYTVCLILQHTA